MRCILANVPSSGVRVIWLASGGVVFSRLSKLLNQENALSAPCLHGDFCPHRGLDRGRAGQWRCERRRADLSLWL
jgi:hypothetical protein